MPDNQLEYSRPLLNGGPNNYPNISLPLEMDFNFDLIILQVIRIAIHSHQIYQHCMQNSRISIFLVILTSRVSHETISILFALIYFFCNIFFLISIRNSAPIKDIHPCQSSANKLPFG